MKNEKNKKQINKHVRIVAGLMLFVALVSVFVISQQSLRLDEAQSLFQASHSVQAIIKIISEDVHVPLYHIMLHFWQIMWGNSIIAARALSLIFFLASIPLIYTVGKLLYGKNVALFATILAAISPFLNWYGNEIRMYSLLMFITLLNQYFFIHIYKSKKNNLSSMPQNTTGDVKKYNSVYLWAGYALSALLGIYTHYFFFLALAAQAMFLLIYKKSFHKKMLHNFMKTGTGLFLAFIPWIYLVVQSKKIAYYSPILGKPKIIDVFNSFSHFLFGFHGDYLNALIISLWPIVGFMAFLTLSKLTMVSRDTIYMFLLIIVPILLAFGVSITFQPMFLTRYFILIVPVLYLVIGWLLSVYTPRISKVIASFLVLGMLGGFLWQTINTDAPVKENYKEVNEYLEQNTHAHDIVVISPPFTIYPTEYYYKGPAALRTLPQWDRLQVGPIPPYSEERLPEDINTIARGHERMWLLVNDLDQGYEEDLVLYFDTNYERLEQIEFSPGLTLHAYKLRYDIPENLRAALEEITRTQ